MAETTEIISREEGPKGPINLFAQFPKFKLQFPFWNQKPHSAEDEPTSTQKPAIVRFPVAQPAVPPVASDTVEEPLNRDSNPLIIWQAAALGGYLVCKWIWARWQERQEKKKDEKEESDDDEQFSSIDE